jgi:hypothetical protein
VPSWTRTKGALSLSAPVTRMARASGHVVRCFIDGEPTSTAARGETRCSLPPSAGASRPSTTNRVRSGHGDPAMTRRLNVPAFEIGPLPGLSCLERVTRIELALSAWEPVQFGLLEGLTCEVGCP